MNADQQRNIRNLIEQGVGHSIHTAWLYLRLLQGIQEGATSDEGKESLATYPFALSVIYQGVFEALYAAIGRICDATKGTQSLPTVITLAKRYGAAADPAVRKVLASVDAKIKNKEDSPLQKIVRWRHEHVAHRKEEALLQEFYDANKLKLGEVEEVIEELAALANSIAEALIASAYDWQSGCDPVRESAANLMRRK